VRDTFLQFVQHLKIFRPVPAYHHAPATLGDQERRADNIDILAKMIGTRRPVIGGVERRESTRYSRAMS
jgi:hypothetical protein